MTSEPDPTIFAAPLRLSPEAEERLRQESLARGIPMASLAREKGLVPAEDGDQPGKEVRLRAPLPGYEMRQVLGIGGMGVVFSARQINLDRIVAVKTILVEQAGRADVIARFEKEAHAVARLRHPNIVTAYDFGQHEGRLYLVMELLEGQTLGQLIQEKGPQDEKRTWLLVRQAVAGLAHAAALGLVHRDIKPSNLFLVEAPLGLGLPAGVPLVKITDFGLVFRQEDGDAARLTQTGLLVGTPLYMAPEQLTGGPVDLRADVYALGATAYHLLTGQPPHPGKSVFEVIAAKVQGGEPADLDTLARRISPGSVDLLCRMLARDPNGRPRTHAELLEQIDRLPVLQHAPHPGSVPRPVAPAGWKRRAAVLGGIVLLLAAGLAAFFVLADRGDLPRPVDPGPPTLVPSGWAEHLYDGQSVGPPGWIILHGQWRSAADAEGGRVLSGQGAARRMLPPLRSYRLVLGVSLFEASAAEVAFGLARQGGAHGVLRITPRQVVLGQRPAEQGTLEAVSSPLTRPAARAEADGPVYHEVRLERHGEYWWAYFDGKQVGWLPARPEQELPELRLTVEGGAAHFENLQVAELVPPGQRP